MRVTFCRDIGRRRRSASARVVEFSGTSSIETIKIFIDRSSDDDHSAVGEQRRSMVLTHTLGTAGGREFTGGRGYGDRGVTLNVVRCAGNHVVETSVCGCQVHACVTDRPASRFLNCPGDGGIGGSYNTCGESRSAIGSKSGEGGVDRDGDRPNGDLGLARRAGTLLAGGNHILGATG